MSKKYRLNLIKTRKSYTVKEIAQLLRADKRTCFRWIKEKGLKPLDPDSKPLLIMGHTLKKFLTDRRQRIKLRDYEYFCVKCQKATIPKEGSEKTIDTGKKIGNPPKTQFIKTAICNTCKSRINRFLGATHETVIKTNSLPSSPHKRPHQINLKL